MVVTTIVLRSVALIMAATALGLLWYGVRKNHYTPPYVIALMVWCVHSIAFYIVSIPNAVGAFPDCPNLTEALTLWSHAIRLHGFITVALIAIYRIDRGL